MDCDVFLKLLDVKKEKLLNSIKEDDLKINNIKKNIEIKIKTKDLISKIAYLKKQEMKILIDVVNKGLNYAYPDKNLNFNMEFSEKNNRIVPEFYLNELELKNPFIGDGGGIISMIGLLLYITFIKLKNIKIVLLDEVESMVDIEASKKLFEFIDYFSKENDIKVLLITHKSLDYEFYELTDKIRMLKTIDR